MKSKEKEFRNFYEENFRIVFNYLRQRSTSYEDAEDLAYEAFNAIWESWGNIQVDNNLKGYLFRICRNKLNDFLRKKYKIKSFETNYDYELEETFKEDEPVAGTTNNYFKHKLLELASNLNDNEKKVFELKYVHNLTSSEIALRLNISKANVKVINNRLIKKLKKLWEKQIMN